MRPVSGPAGSSGSAVVEPSSFLLLSPMGAYSLRSWTRTATSTPMTNSATRNGGHRFIPHTRSPNVANMLYGDSMRRRTQGRMLKAQSTSTLSTNCQCESERQKAASCGWKNGKPIQSHARVTMNHAGPFKYPVPGIHISQAPRRNKEAKLNIQFRPEIAQHPTNGLACRTKDNIDEMKKSG